MTPALSFENTRSTEVEWQGRTWTLWQAQDLDEVLEAFGRETGQTLDADRCPFGMVLWPSARAYADALPSLALEAVQSPKRILELGCGVGFVSACLARVFPEAEVVATDYEGGLGPIVQKNAHAFGVGERVTFRRLDWRSPVAPDLFQTFDWVVGCDVLYDDAHLENLPLRAAELLGPMGTFHLADPRRFRYVRACETLRGLFGLHEERVLPVRIEASDVANGLVALGYRSGEVSFVSCRFPKLQTVMMP